MTRIVVDAALLDKLGNLSQFMELCDDSGRVLAQLVPVPSMPRHDPDEPVTITIGRKRGGQWAEYRRNQAALLRQEAAKLLAAASAGNRELPFFIGPMVARLRSMINELTEADETEGNTLMILNQLSDALRNDAGSAFSEPAVVRGVIEVIDAVAKAESITPGDARNAYRRLQQLALKPFVPTVLDFQRAEQAEELSD